MAAPDVTNLLTSAGVGGVNKYSLSDPGAAQYDYYKDQFATGSTIHDNLTNLLLLAKQKGTSDPMFLYTLTELAVGPKVDASTQQIAKRELTLVNTDRKAKGLGMINVAGGVPLEAPTFTLAQPTAPSAPTYIDLLSFNTVGSTAYNTSKQILLNAGYIKSGTSYTSSQLSDYSKLYNTNTKSTYDTATNKYNTDLTNYNTAYSKYQTDLTSYTNTQAALKPINEASDLTLASSDKQAVDLKNKLDQQLAANELAKRKEAFRATLSGLASRFISTPKAVITPSVVLAKTKLGGS